MRSGVRQLHLRPELVENRCRDAMLAADISRLRTGTLLLQYLDYLLVDRFYTHLEEVQGLRSNPTTSSRHSRQLTIALAPLIP